MRGFGPIKKHAREFKYTPRYYDPVREERDRRRQELRGTSAATSDEEYTPGDYIRRQSEARRSRQNLGKRQSGRSTMIFMVLGAVLIFMLAYIMLPKLIGAFTMSGTTPTKIEAVDEYKEFDPYAPLRIVPNDYNGE